MSVYQAEVNYGPSEDKLVNTKPGLHSTEPQSAIIGGCNRPKTKLLKKVQQFKVLMANQRLKIRITEEMPPKCCCFGFFALHNFMLAANKMIEKSTAGKRKTQEKKQTKYTTTLI